jgi:HNH endonuclease
MSESWHARFWGKIAVAGDDECWPWRGALDPGGYGAFKLNGRKQNAHRIALELRIGRPISPGMLVCHTCNVRACCNPAHLYEGTSKQNVEDMMAAGTHSGWADRVIDVRLLRGNRGRIAQGFNEVPESVILDIYARANAGERLKALADEYSQYRFTKESVKSIKQGRSWRWLTNPD